MLSIIHGNVTALTSIATPGTNITTAKPWKNFLRAFKLSVGTCLSAASKRSVATFVIFAPLGRFGKFGRLGRLGIFGNDAGNDMPSGPLNEAEVAGEAPILSVPATVGSVGVDAGEFVTVDTTLSLIEGSPFLGLNLLDLASCRLHPATLILTSKAQ